MTKDVNPNSALYWLTRIKAEKALAPLVPRTELVPYDHAAMIEALEGGDYPGWSSLVLAVKEAAARVRYPAFIRTDLSSAKHGGPRCYLAARSADTANVLCRTAEDNEMKFWMSPEQPRAFLVREFLDLDASFTAFGGLPVAREWRFFATPSAVLCAHPYWPAEIFEEDGPEGWRDALASLHERQRADEWDGLTRLAVTAAAACPAAPSWSVDFARDKSGKWWLIDMAVAEQSWHWPSCARPASPTE